MDSGYEPAAGLNQYQTRTTSRWWKRGVNKIHTLDMRLRSSKLSTTLRVIYYGTNNRYLEQHIRNRI